MKRASSPEDSFGTFKKHLRKRRGIFGIGLFTLAMGVSGISGGPSSQQETNEIIIEAAEAGESVAKRADSIDYSFSLSVDCLLSFGGAKQLDRLGLSREAYLPLDMGIKQGGGLSNVFLMGQRAPGEKDGGRITDGWGVVYDKGNQKYYMYEISTENRSLADGESIDGDRTLVPYIVARPMDMFGLDELKQGLRYTFGDMAVSFSYQLGNPSGPFHVNLACVAPGS